MRASRGVSLAQLEVTRAPAILGNLGLIDRWDGATVSLEDSKQVVKR